MSIRKGLSILLMACFSLMTACAVVAEAGVSIPCTLPDSRVQNTGILEAVNIPDGPIAGQLEYQVCNQAGVWNLAEDLKVGVSAIPYRGWSLLHATPVSYDPQNFVPLNAYVHKPMENGQVILKAWQPLGSGDVPVIGVFDSGTKPQYVSGEILPFKKGMVYLHPGPYFSAPGANIIKWQGDFSGSISVVGSVFSVYRPAGSCGDGVRWALMINTQIVREGELVPVSGDAFRVNSIAVTPADSVYFILDPKSEVPCDGTALDLEIRKIGGAAPVIHQNGYE